MEKSFSKRAQCCGCGVCAASCPCNAIKMKEDKEGFLYPLVNKHKCSHCGKCEEACPRKSTKENRGEVYLGAQARDDKIRYSGTSGGVFTVLASWVLSKGGIVFGAAMEKNGFVHHKAIQDIREITTLQKAKYVQSDVSDCYKKAEQLLKHDRLVLFSGTPCQCQAMKQYIGEENKNLLLVDLICYGVPSPGIWKKYVSELGKKYKGKMYGFCFRDKRKNDNGHTVSMNIGGKEYSCPMNDDLFCRLYFRNYSIRPSCYQCSFAVTTRDSDITIGDFWGIDNVKPEMDDGMGTSLIILHNQKAAMIWDTLKEDFRSFQCTRENALQPRLCSPTPMPRKRWLFMMLNRFLPLGIIEKLLRRGWL